MATVAKRTIIIGVLWSLALLAQADTPAPQRSFKKETVDGRHVFIMRTPGHVPTGASTQSGLYLKGEPSPKPSPLWTVDWYSHDVDLTDDGRYMVRPGPWARSFDDLAVAFYDRGRLVNAYSIDELVTDRSTVMLSASHFMWTRDWHFDARNKHLRITVTSGETYRFDVTTGQLVETVRWVSGRARAKLMFTDGRQKTVANLRNCSPMATILSEGPEDPGGRLVVYKHHAVLSGNATSGSLLSLPFGQVQYLRRVEQPQGGTPDWEMRTSTGDTLIVRMEPAFSVLCDGDSGQPVAVSEVRALDITEVSPPRTEKRSPSPGQPVMVKFLSAYGTVASYEAEQFKRDIENRRLSALQEALGFSRKPGASPRHEATTRQAGEQLASAAASIRQATALIKEASDLLYDLDHQGDDFSSVKSLIGASAALWEDNPSLQRLRERAEKSERMSVASSQAYAALAQKRYRFAGQEVARLEARYGQHQRLTSVKDVLKRSAKSWQRRMAAAKRQCRLALQEGHHDVFAVSARGKAGNLRVHVSGGDAPVVLFLVVRTFSNWRVELTPGTRIAGVVLAGRQRSSVEGLPAGTPELYVGDSYQIACPAPPYYASVHGLLALAEVTWALTGHDLSALTIEEEDQVFRVGLPATQHAQTRANPLTHLSKYEASKAPTINVNLLREGQAGIDQLIGAGALRVAEPRDYDAWATETSQPLWHFNPKLRVPSPKPKPNTYVLLANTTLPTGLSDDRSNRHRFIVPRGLDLPAVAAGPRRPLEFLMVKDGRVRRLKTDSLKIGAPPSQ